MKVIEKHPLWLRCTHWLNVPLLGLMIWSGLLIYWANDIYPGFFPAWFYRVFRIEGRLAEGLAVHFTVAWVFILNGFLYGAMVLLSGHWRELFPNLTAAKDLPATVLHDMGLRAEAPPQGKFNSAQRFAYTGVGLLALLEVLSGFSIYKPTQLSWLTALFGGYESARLVHFLGLLCLSGFVLLHLLQVMRAGWNNFRAMVAGFEIEDE